MTTIRKFTYAALLAFTTLNITPNAAAAEESAHGKFTLTHDVHWGNGLVAAGDYEFSYDPYQSSPVLILSKVSGARTSYMLLVTSAEESKPSDSNQLLLETVADSSYVSTMQLASCGMTLHFIVPSHPLKQMAKAAASVAAAAR